MPIYEYQCRDCNSRFEALRLYKDADVAIQCARCSSKKTVRVMSTCYSKSDGSTSTSRSSGCTGCSGGSCGSCGH